MIDFLRKNFLRIMAGCILLAALLFYSLNLRQKESANAFERVVLGATAPIAGVVSGVDAFFSGIWHDYVFLVGVRKENIRLREAVEKLNTRLIRDRENLLENERLKKLLQLKDAMDSPSIAASIIGEDVTPWFSTVIIDRGSIDGIREGMPVVASAGLVGRVVRQAANSSRLLLITDHASAVAATIERSRARGVVKGKGAGLCSLEFSERGEDVKVGDIVVTSGIGGVFPKGIPIGEVSMVKKGEFGIFQTVELRPFVSMSRLEEVLVLVR
jgi:rod shape-determining protein MreC